MKKKNLYSYLLASALIFFMVCTGNAQVCHNFNNGLNNWSGVTLGLGTPTLRTTPNPSPDGTQYVFLADGSGSSYFVNNDFNGDLRCTQFCFDFNLINDGVGGSPPFGARFTIYQGQGITGANTVRATFTQPTTVTENDGWNNFCVNIPNVQAVPNGWNLTGGGTWQQLITNVTGIAFTTDYPAAATAGERIGIDNVCMNIVASNDNLTWFPRSEFCRVGDDLEITFNANPDIQNTEVWNVRLVNIGEPCDRYSPNQQIFQLVTSQPQNTFILPLPFPLTYTDIIGRCLIFQHGYVNDCGNWVEFRRAVPVPDIPPVDAIFGSVPDPSTPSPTHTPWTFTPGVPASSYGFGVTHDWTISSSPNLGGPYTPWNGTMGAPGAEVLTALLENNLFFFVCHEISSDEDGICTRDQWCDIICPVASRDCMPLEARQEVIASLADNYEIKERFPLMKINTNIDYAKTDHSNIETTIFPNPAKEEFNFENNSEQSLTIEIYSTTGQLIQTDNVELYSVKNFSTSNFNSGLYIVRIIDTNTGQVIKTEKLVVAK